MIPSKTNSFSSASANAVMLFPRSVSKCRHPEEWEIPSTSSPAPSYDSFTSQDELDRCVELHKRVKNDDVLSSDDYFCFHYILRVYG